MRGKCWHAQKSEKLWRKGERTRKELQDEGVLALTSPSHIGDESEDQKQVNSSTSSTSIKVRRRVHPVASFVTVKRSSGANDQSEHNDDYDDVGNDEKTRAKNDYDDDLDGTTFLKLEAEADNTTFASITRQALATIAPLTAVPGDVVTCIAYIDDPIPHARFFINDMYVLNSSLLHHMYYLYPSALVSCLVHFAPLTMHISYIFLSLGLPMLYLPD